MRIICVCGRPLSGKTAAAQLLREIFGWTVIEADRIGRSVTLNEPDFVLFNREADGTDRQSEYPYHDAMLVEWERPDCFWCHLEKALKSVETPVVLVGLRSAQMLRRLRQAHPRRIHLVYIAAGSRICAARYAERTGSPKASYTRRLEYAVESGQDALRRSAQLVLSNASSLAALRRRLESRVRSDGRVSRGPLEHCSRCGKLAPVHFRKGQQKVPVCRECYEIEFNSEPCSVCQKLRPVHKRDRDRKPICKNCYQKIGNVQVCVRCNEARPVHRRDESGQPLCRRCSGQLYGRA